MKKMIFIMMLGVLFLSIFSGVLVDKCSAEELYILSMEDPTYEFISSVEKGGRIYGRFNITVVLHNSGTDDTPLMVVELTDDDGIPIRRNGKVGPGEFLSFVFNNVDFRPVEDKNEYNAYISYSPDDPYLGNNENQGETTLVLKISGVDDSSSTPGFEIVFLLVIIISYVVFKKYRK